MIDRMRPRGRWWRDGSVLLVLGPLAFTLLGCTIAAYETDPAAWPRFTVASVLVGFAAAALGAWLLWRAERRQSEKHQAQTRRRVAELHALGDLVDVLLWCTAPDGTVTYLSRRWVDHTGKPTSAMLQDLNWLDAIHPDDRHETERSWQASLAEGRPYEVQHRIRGADETYRWFRSSGLPLRDSQERIIGWFGCSSDIGDRRRRGEATFDMLATLESAERETRPIATPPMLPVVDEVDFEVARRNEPGSDDGWCDVFALPDGRVFVTLGRTSGLSESAAVGVVRDARRFLSEIAIEEQSPGAVLDRLNVAMLMRRSGSIATLCGYVDRATCVLEYSTAGHDGVFVGGLEGVHRLPGGGPPIGVYAGPAYSSHAIVLLDALLIIINGEAAEHTPAEKLSAAVETLRAGTAAFSAAAIGDIVGAAGAHCGTVLTMRGKARALDAVP